MRLPNYQNAFIDDTKLVEYCLNMEHGIGKHKAQVFKSALRITAQNYFLLKQEILKAIADKECEETEMIEHGKLYVVDFEMTNFGLKAEVRSSWIIRNNEDFPRLTTCYIKT